jgi:hypothetical protein
LLQRALQLDPKVKSAAEAMKALSISRDVIARATVDEGG